MVSNDKRQRQNQREHKREKNRLQKQENNKEKQWESDCDPQRIHLRKTESPADKINSTQNKDDKEKLIR